MQTGNNSGNTRKTAGYLRFLVGQRRLSWELGWLHAAQLRVSVPSVFWCPLCVMIWLFGLSCSQYVYLSALYLDDVPTLEIVCAHVTKFKVGSRRGATLKFPLAEHDGKGPT